MATGRRVGLVLGSATAVGSLVLVAGMMAAPSTAALATVSPTTVPPPTTVPAHAPTTMTVKPDTNLVGGQTVTVTASGFTPHVSLAIVECSPRALHPPAGFGEQDECDISNDLVLTSSDGTGKMATTAFKVPRTGSTFPFTARDPAAVCPPSRTTYCGIVVANINNYNERAIAGIAFKGQVPPPNGNLGAAPTTDLQKGSQISVAGSFFPASRSFRIEECSTDASIPHDGSACYLPGAVTVKSDANGFLTATLTIQTGNLGGNPNANCPPTAAQRAAGVGCEIVAQAQSSFSNGIPIYFSPGRITVSPPVHGVGTYQLTVSAPDFATFGSPPGCSASVDATHDTCTSVTGEKVTLTINGAVFGTVRADPLHGGLAKVLTEIRFVSKGTYTLVMQGQTSGETTQTTLQVT